MSTVKSPRSALVARAPWPRRSACRRARCRALLGWFPGCAQWVQPAAPANTEDAHAHADDEHEHAADASGNTLELAPQAQATMNLQLATVSLQPSSA